MPVIRASICLLILVFGLSLASGQIDMRPGATVVIKQDDSGSDLVNISMFDPKYPESLLQQQIASLGPELGVAPRGVSIFTQSFGPQPDQKLVKAQFAINGVIIRARREVKLAAFVRMFAGAPAPFTINGVKIILDGEVPNANTLRTYSNEGVVVDGSASPNPPALEYLVLLKTQDPTKINIPLKHEPAEVATPEKPASNPPITNVLIPLIVLASIATGALVYFLMVGRGGNGSSRKLR